MRSKWGLALLFGFFPIICAVPLSDKELEDFRAKCYSYSHHSAQTILAGVISTVNNILNDALNVNGGWSRWYTQSRCSATCGRGVKTYIRYCNNPTPAYGGRNCHGSSTKDEACKLRPCQVNGGWSRWYIQSRCSATCGTGVITYIRYCNNPTPAYGGHNCHGPSTKYEACKLRPCPVNGSWSGWYTQSRCSATCGRGVITYIRYCNNPTPTYGGRNCHGPSTMFKTCKLQPCPVDGGWSNWQNPTQCSVTCGGGLRTRTRTCNHPTPTKGGHQCQGRSLQREHCNTNPCPVNGGWSSWQNPSQCTKTCGGGSRVRTRTCTNPTPANNGHHCLGSTLKIEHCNTYTCPAPTTSTTLPTTITSSTPQTTTTTPRTTTTTPSTTTTTPLTTTTTPATTTTTQTTTTKPTTTTTTPPTTTTIPPTTTTKSPSTTTTPATPFTTTLTIKPSQQTTTTTPPTTTATQPTTTKLQLTTTKLTPTTTKGRFFTIRALPMK